MTAAMRRLPLNVSGVVLTLVSVSLLIAGVVLLPGGGAVSLLGALAIAAAFAGVGHGVLRLFRSGGAAERAATSTLDDDEARHRDRRSLRVQSVVFVVFGAVIVAMSVWAGGSRGEDGIRFVIFGGALVVAGVGGLVVAARAGNLRAESDAEPEAPAHAAAGEDRHIDGWRLVTRRDLLTVVTIAAPGVGLTVLLIWQATSLVLSTTRMTSGRALVVTVVVIALLVVAVIVVVRRMPNVWVDVGAQRVRCGSRVASWTDVTAARLSAASFFAGGTRSLVLTLEGRDKLRVPLLLRRRGRLAMTPEQRSAVLALIEGAHITLPRAPEDPKGRFSRMLYPAHLDGAQAREMVARPPRSDEQLPVPLV